MMRILQLYRSVILTSICILYVSGHDLGFYVSITCIYTYIKVASWCLGSAASDDVCAMVYGVGIVIIVTDVNTSRTYTLVFLRIDQLKHSSDTRPAI